MKNKNKIKMIIGIIIILLIIISVFVYVLFRYEWNNYAIGKTYQMQGISDVIEKDSSIILTTLNPYLFISNDFGKTWRVKLFNLKKGEENFTDLGIKNEVIYFISRKNSAGNTSSQFLYTSNNYGNSWKKRDINNLIDFNKNISSESVIINNGIIECLDENLNKYYQSTDFGKTWKNSNSSIRKMKGGNSKSKLIYAELGDNTFIIKRKNEKNNESIKLFSIEKDFEINLFGNIKFKN